MAALIFLVYLHIMIIVNKRKAERRYDDDFKIHFHADTNEITLPNGFNKYDDDNEPHVRCYHCHKRFTTKDVAIRHCLSDHPHKSLSILKPSGSGPLKKYVAIHYADSPESVMRECTSFGEFMYNDETLTPRDDKPTVVLYARRGSTCMSIHSSVSSMENLALEGLDPTDLPVYYTDNEAPFFMRIGLIVFGLGTVVLDGFRLVQFTHSDEFWLCYGLLFLVHTILRLIFIFMLIIFIFKNHRVVANFKRPLVRLGYFHVMVTCLCIWALAVVMETAESYMHGVADAIKVRMNATGQQKDPGEALTVAEECYSYHSVADYAAPYLFPCVVQFMLLAVAIIWRMYRNMKGPCATEAQNGMRNIIECQKATSGLFLGLVFLTATLIAVCFFLLFDPDETSHPMVKRSPMFVYESMDIVVTLAALIATLVAFCHTRRLNYAERDGVTLHEVLIAVGLAAVLALIICMIPAAEIDNGPDLIYARLQCASVAINFVQATIQSIFVVTALHRFAFRRRQIRDKPGRSMITFLLLCNLCLWLLRSFEWKVDNGIMLYTNYYGELPWAILTHLLMPLTVFFRFHACVCLSLVWSQAYRGTR